MVLGAQLDARYLRRVRSMQDLERERVELRDARLKTKIAERYGVIRRRPRFIERFDARHWDWPTITTAGTNSAYSAYTGTNAVFTLQTFQYTSATTTTHWYSNAAPNHYRITVSQDGRRWHRVNDEIWQAWRTNPRPSAYTFGEREVLWRSDIWHAWEADAARNHEGMIRDWDVGDWVDEDTYNERQRLRQEAADRRRAEQQAAALVRAEERKQADTRADALLRLILTEHQIREWDADHAVTVRSQHGRRYVVRKGWAGNVIEVDEQGRKKRSFCIHPSTAMPEADNVAAQILMLKTDEDPFLATANAGA